MTASPAPRRVPRRPVLPEPSAAAAMELWTITDLIGFLPWRRSTVYRLTRQPWFPAALALPGPDGPRRVWLAAEIRAWVLAAPRGRGRPDRHRRTDMMTSESPIRDQADQDQGIAGRRR